MACNKISPLGEWLRKAYKKFKSNAYFDRTNAPVRESIIHFETSADWSSLPDMEKHFQKIENALSGDDTAWMDFQKSILNDTMAYCYPKKLGK